MTAIEWCRLQGLSESEVADMLDDLSRIGVVTLMLDDSDQITEVLFDLDS